MTEYDFSPEAYDRYIQTQNRVANWVHQTEQHRQTFEAAAPGAPGIPPVIRRPSPPLPDHYAGPSPTYQRPPRYHRAPPSSSSSEDSYVHVVQPQIKRRHPPPPPIYAPPVPPPAPRAFKSHPSSFVVRMDNDHLSPSSSRHRHHRSKSYSHSHRSPPPLVTPIYTSPAPSSFVPPPPVIYMPAQGYAFPMGTRPIIPSREQYTNSPQIRKSRPSDPPIKTSPTTSSSTTSSSDASTSAYNNASSPNSPTSLPFPSSSTSAPYSGPHHPGLGGSHSHHPHLQQQQDQNQKSGQTRNQHRGHLSSTVLPGLEPPYISRNLQSRQVNTSATQRRDCQPRPYHHPYHDQGRRSSNSSYQSQSRHSPVTLRPQLHHGDLLYERVNQPNPSGASTGVISISVPPVPRYPIDERETSYGQSNPISLSRARTHQPTLVVHAPQPIKHSSLLSPRLRASARA